MEGGRVPDAELVREALEGDRDELSALIRRYEGAVYAAILEVLSGQEDIQDLVQETYCRACSNLAGLDDPQRFGAWIRAIARNQAIGLLRSRSVRRRIELPVPGPVPNPHELCEQREMRARVGDAVRLLPAELREVVLLYYTERRSQTQIAWDLGVTVATVKRRLGKAKETLRTVLRPRAWASAQDRMAGATAYATRALRSAATARRLVNDRAPCRGSVDEPGGGYSLPRLG